MLMFEIRWTIRKDLPQIIAIENEAFEDGWTEEDFKRALKSRNSVGMVAEDIEKKGSVLGYIVYERHRNKYEIINLAVEKRLRGMGIGSGLVRRVISKLEPWKRSSVELVVGDENLEAHLFLKSIGFQASVAGSNTYKFEYSIRKEPDRQKRFGIMR